MFVLPRDGYTIVDPYKHDHLPATGREVPEDHYWNVLLLQGDVIACTPPAAPQTPETTEGA